MKRLLAMLGFRRCLNCNRYIRARRVRMFPRVQHARCRACGQESMWDEEEAEAARPDGR